MLDVHAFNDPNRSLVERAEMLRAEANARGRVGLFQHLVFELSRRETDTTTTVADLFEATFADRSGAAFWRARLSEMTDVRQFIAMLLPHLTAENSNRSRNEFLLDEMMRNHVPASGLLREGRFDPLPVVRWLGERESYRDMLPASLHAFVKIAAGHPSQVTAPKPIALAPRTGAPGHPSSMHLILAQRDARAARGETLGTKKDEAAALYLWFKHAHPSLPAPTELTIRNRLSKVTK